MLPVCFGTISCMHHLIHIFQRVTLGISYLIPFSRLFRHQVTPLRPFPSKQSYHRAQKSYLWWHEAKIFTAERTREGGEGPRGACAPQKILTGTFNLVSGHALHAAFWFSSIRSENYLFIAVAIWPVTGQCFQNPKWPAVRYFQYIWLIKESQPIQTIICRIRKVKWSWNALYIPSLAFGLSSAQKTKPHFVTLRTFSSFLFPLSSFLFPLSSFRFILSSFLFPLSLSHFPTYLGKIEETLLSG